MPAPLNKLFVSFRIAYDDPKSYNAILSALDGAVRQTAVRVWDETTSFYFIETNETSQKFVARVRAAAGMRRQDLLVVVNLTHQGATFWGAFANLPLLKHFLPYAQQFPAPVPTPAMRFYPPSHR